MGTTTKKDLVDRIAAHTGQSREAVREVVQQFLDEIVFELANENRLEFRYFGVFEVKQRPARMGRNPRTLESVRVPPKHTVKFKPGGQMRGVMTGLDRAICGEDPADPAQERADGRARPEIGIRPSARDVVERPGVEKTSDEKPGGEGAGEDRRER